MRPVINIRVNEEKGIRADGNVYVHDGTEDVVSPLVTGTDTAALVVHAG